MRENMQKLREVKHVVAKIINPLLYPLPSYWMNDLANSNLSWRQFFPCHTIHEYSISIAAIAGSNYMNQLSNLLNEHLP